MKSASVLIKSICLSVFIASCSQSDHKAVVANQDANDKTATSVTENDFDISVRATKKEVEKKPVVSIKQTKKTISINGEKYIYTDDKLEKGSEVRNIKMSESGKIKGTFIVVAKAGELLEVSFKHKSIIAKDTYRITPKPTDDLITVYNQLLSNESLTRVELEVLYSKIKEAARY